MDPSAIAQKVQSARGALAFTDQFFPFSPESLAGEVFGREGATQGHRRRGDAEVEACGELHCPQDAQSVFGKLRRSVTQDPGIEVALAMIRISESAAERVVENRVQGEVAAGGGVFERHRGIDRDGKILVPWSGGAFASGECDIDLIGVGFPDRKRFTDKRETPGCSQDGLELVAFEAEHFGVQVGTGFTAEGIANRSTHEPEAAARAIDIPGEFAEQFDGGGGPELM